MLARLVRAFGAKKKKEAEMQMLSSDIVNIFKDRADPEPVALADMPLAMHKAFFSQRLGRMAPVNYLQGEADSCIESTDISRLPHNVRRLNRLHRAYYKQVFMNPKKEQLPPERLNVYDVFSDKLEEI
jgi:hypothetical protein